MVLSWVIKFFRRIYEVFLNKYEDPHLYNLIVYWLITFGFSVVFLIGVYWANFDCKSIFYLPELLDWTIEHTWCYLLIILAFILPTLTLLLCHQVRSHFAKERDREIARRVDAETEAREALIAQRAGGSGVEASRRAISSVGPKLMKLSKKDIERARKTDLETEAREIKNKQKASKSVSMASKRVTAKKSSIRRRNESGEAVASTSAQSSIVTKQPATPNIWENLLSPTKKKDKVYPI